MIKHKDITIISEGGVALAARLFAPENPKAAVQINGGTAVKKEYYAAFARFLAENGFVSVIFDYRGCGGSKPADLAECDYSFLDYGVKDMPAVLDYLEAHYPDLPKLVVGHSVGGQQIGFYV
ncbi:MAG: alpha/beta fold hydrolase [Saprospiraceae bacterium]|nr:alpha/beta fold hydrolase [Saprospiraceae bacterium]